MAAIGESNLTILDIQKRMDPDGKLATIAELLNQTNEIIGDIPWQESNETNGHRMTMRTSLPGTYWRKYNEAISPSKSTTAQVTEGIGNQEAYQEMGDRDGAREILQEVIKEGDGEQQAQAKRLMDSLG